VSFTPTGGEFYNQEGRKKSSMGVRFPMAWKKQGKKVVSFTSKGGEFYKYGGKSVSFSH